MREVSCNIIRDILPLYVDEVVSEDTKKLVEEHLAGCESCRKEAEDMGKPIAIPMERETKVFQKLKQKWRRKILLVIVIAAAFMFGFYVPFCAVGTLVSSGEVKVTTWVDENQMYWIQFETTDGSRELNWLAMDYSYEDDGSGESTETGTVLKVKSRLFYSRENRMPLGLGWDYQEGYVVKVVFRDKTVVYTMQDGGLYETEVIE